MKVRGIKRMMMAAALAVATAVSGMAGQAQALEFGNGDLVFALYGNNTQYLRNLGQVSNLFTGGSEVVVNIDPTHFSQVTGVETLKWALYSASYDEATGLPTLYHAGSTKAPSAFTPTELSQVQIVNSWNPTIVQSGLMSGDGNVGVHVLPASHPQSFTNTFSTDGRLAGGWPVSMEGTLGSTLHLLEGIYDTNAISQIGTAVLALNGSTMTLTAPVPVPAAVILFGSGMIGIVGIARRKLFQA